MNKICRMAQTVFVLGLLASPAIGADPTCDTCVRPPYDGVDVHYSKCNYRFPLLVRLNANLHPGPRVSNYATDLYPGVPTAYQVITYPCPYVYPAGSLVTRPPNVPNR